MSNISAKSMDLNVFIKETIYLKPLSGENESKRSQTLELSGLDRISPAILHAVFFYRPNINLSCGTERDDYDDAIFERAKRALQRALVSWFPAAGRLRTKQGTGKLEIDCNDKGVMVITAEYKDCYEKLVPQLPNKGNRSDSPLVVVQITKFSWGAISLGFGFSHALFDGFGASNFLASWAHISRGIDEKSTHDQDQQLIIPNHSSQKLFHAINNINTSDATNISSSKSAASSSIYEQDHIMAIQELYGIPMQTMASDDRFWESQLAKFGKVESQLGFKLLALCMKKKIVETWKGFAVESGQLSKCSTFDVLCAHVWKARVKALSLKPNTNIYLQFPADSRRRLRPPLGNNFTDNAFVLASVSCAAKDLTVEPLHNTIWRIQAAKYLITDEYIKLYAKALECSSNRFFPYMRELTIITN